MTMAPLPTYLEWHGRRLRVRVKVPMAARAALGKTKLVHPLHTDSLTEANRLKLPHVYRFKAMIEEAKRPGSRPADPLDQEAFRWREMIRAERESSAHRSSQRSATSLFQEQPLTPDEVERLDAQGLIDPPTQEELLAHRASDIESREGLVTALRFHRVASDQVTPLRENLDAFLIETAAKAKTNGDRRRTLKALETWCRERGIETTLQAITRKVGGRFVSEHLAKGRAPTTVNKALSDLSSYWRWMVRRGHAAENPWSEQGFRVKGKHRRHARHKERPFTAAEVIKLLAGPADPMLRDLMRIAALSGMRIEEICSLRVGDCQDGRFKIIDAKTPAGIRAVPIHSGLRAIIEARSSGHHSGDLLFPELPPVPPSRREDDKRSDPASKAFTRYRRKSGVDHRVPGQRRSLVNFHSFRRWFAAQAQRALEAGAAGFTPWTLADVLGHDREQLALPMTMGTYGGQSDHDAHRACVEAVKLPDLR
jgi:integrase